MEHRGKGFFKTVRMMIGALIIMTYLPGPVLADRNAPVIIDHHCSDIWQIPGSAIEQAKATLHIAYGHTSHGSQLISGMGESGTELDAFMTNNGAMPGLYVWHDGPQAGALDLDNYFVSGDLGNPDRVTWAQRTRDYLDNPANADVNVVIWSWCGQVDGSEAEINTYLTLMDALETDYPNVIFVYMTGHLNGTGTTGNVHIRNNQIRAFCIANNKVLYDFADIESYDPEGLVNYMELLANDNCDYDSDGNGSRDKNWALDWQDSHTEGVDWWASGAAHSQHLNGNRKGYAAWWLWASLAGWNRCIPAPSGLTAVADSANREITLAWLDNSSSPNEDSFIVQRRFNGGAWSDLVTLGADTTSHIDSGLAIGIYGYRIMAHLDDGGDGTPCDSFPSNVATAEILSAEPPLAPLFHSPIPDSCKREVLLTWTDNADNETGFHIHRKADGGSWDEAYATAGQNVTNYTDQDVAPGSYQYRVEAYNDFGQETSNEEGAVIEDMPLPPTGLSAIADSMNGAVSLTWMDNSAGETVFIVQRRVDNALWEESYDSVEANVTTYLDDNHGAGPLPNGVYTYRVVADKDGSNCGPSEEDVAVIASAAPEAPTNLTSSISSFDIALTWSDNSDNEEKFLLERAIDGGVFLILEDALPPETVSYVDADLQPLHTYTYRVRASNSFGDSDYSNETSQYVPEETFTIRLENTSEVYDAFLVPSSPDTNYGSTQYLSSIEHYAVGFILPEAVMGKRIVGASIGFYGWNQTGVDDGDYLDLYRITHSWVEEEVTWNRAESDYVWTVPGGDYDTLLGSTPMAGTCDHCFFPEIHLTYLVQEWADQTLANHGVMLVNDSTASTGIKASEYSPGARTYLCVTYTNKLDCPGDMDRDGDVDGIDLAIFSEAYRTATPSADLSNNGKVNKSDCSLFADCFARADCL